MPIRPSSLGSREPDYSPGVSVGLVVVALLNVHLPCDQFMFITNKHVDLKDWVHSSAWSRRRPSACDSLHRCRNFCFPGDFLSFHPHLLVHIFFVTVAGGWLLPCLLPGERKQGRRLGAILSHLFSARRSFEELNDFF